MVMAADHQDAIDATVARYFRRFQNDVAALAPDGRHLALSENIRGKPAALVIVAIDDNTSQRYPLGEDAATDHSVQQLVWVSPTRVVFTTRSRGLGAVDVDRSEIRALLVGTDLDSYVPRPELGARHVNVTPTPDMPADPNMQVGPADMIQRREMTFNEALAHAKVSGDLFGQESRRDPGLALRPFVVGVKPGGSGAIFVEIRDDADLLARPRPPRNQLTVPGNVIVTDRMAGFDPYSATPVQPMMGYASYDIERAPTPLVVLELDTAKGRRRELLSEVDWRRVWFDQQGRPRLALEQRGSRLRYLYCGIDGKKWIPLDSLVKTGTPLGFEVTAENLLAPRSVPLGFDANGQVLFVASNVGRPTYALRGLDLVTGKFVPDFQIGHERFDLIEPTAVVAGDVLRFDPHTQRLAGLRFASTRRDTTWLNAEAAAVQAGLSKKFAPQFCEVLAWDAGRTRFLVDISSAGDPGGFAVFDAAATKFIRFGDRAPWLAAEELNATRPFDFQGEDGRRLAGVLTLPRRPRLTPAPVLIYFHDGPWFSDPPTFNRGAQALASLGFAVLQLNHRGSSGYGRDHLMAIDAGLDRVVLEDVRALLTRLTAGKLPINPRLVATFGNGVGGYLAVRMLQLAPEAFRCAVAINAPGDLDAWRSRPESTATMWSTVRQRYFGADRERLRAASAVAAGAATRAPVLVVHATEDSYVPFGLGRELYHALKKGCEETAFVELRGEGHGGWSEQTTARLFAELGRFFNATVYNYGVEVRRPEVVR